MKLKHATIVVLICLGISIIWSMAGLVLPPEALQKAYRSRLPSLLFIIRDVSFMVFFFILFKNQR